LAGIPLGLKAKDADYPILRVFASWPGSAELNRSLDWKEHEDTKMRSQAEASSQLKRKQSADNIEDPDLHPLATLHLKNFEANSLALDESWYRGNVQEKLGISAKQARQNPDSASLLRIRARMEEYYMET
jgi:hypothetical protein